MNGWLMSYYLIRMKYGGFYISTVFHTFPYAFSGVTKPIDQKNRVYMVCLKIWHGTYIFKPKPKLEFWCMLLLNSKFKVTVKSDALFYFEFHLRFLLLQLRLKPQSQLAVDVWWLCATGLASRDYCEWTLR